MNPVRWFEIYVENMPRAKSFYESVFAVTLTKIDTPILRRGGSSIIRINMVDQAPLVKMPGLTPGHNTTLVYFASEDCSVEEKKVPSSAARFINKKCQLAHGFISLAIDTEGNMFGIHSIK